MKLYFLFKSILIFAFFSISLASETSATTFTSQRDSDCWIDPANTEPFHILDQRSGFLVVKDGRLELPHQTTLGKGGDSAAELRDHVLPGSFSFMSPEGMNNGPYDLVVDGSNPRRYVTRAPNGELSIADKPIYKRDGKTAASNIFSATCDGSLQVQHSNGSLVDWTFSQPDNVLLLFPVSLFREFRGSGHSQTLRKRGKPAPTPTPSPKPTLEDFMFEQQLWQKPPNLDLNEDQLDELYKVLMFGNRELEGKEKIWNNRKFVPGTSKSQRYDMSAELEERVMMLEGNTPKYKPAPETIKEVKEKADQKPRKDGSIVDSKPIREMVKLLNGKKAKDEKKSEVKRGRKKTKGHKASQQIKEMAAKLGKKNSKGRFKWNDKVKETKKTDGILNDKPTATNSIYPATTFKAGPEDKPTNATQYYVKGQWANESHSTNHHKRAEEPAKKQFRPPETKKIPNHDAGFFRGGFFELTPKERERLHAGLDRLDGQNTDKNRDEKFFSDLSPRGRAELHEALMGRNKYYLSLFDIRGTIAPNRHAFMTNNSYIGKFTKGKQPRCHESPDDVLTRVKSTKHQVVPRGCGAKGIRSNKLVAEYRFHSCCNRHDVCYSDCRETFELCNFEFKECMLEKCHLQDLARKVTLNDTDWVHVMENEYVNSACEATAAHYFNQVMGRPNGYGRFKRINDETCECYVPEPQCFGTQKLCDISWRKKPNGDVKAIYRNYNTQCFEVMGDDRNHCGKCNTELKETQICRAGVIMDLCEEGEVDSRCGKHMCDIANKNPMWCTDKCVLSNEDLHNCGKCGNVCPSGICMLGHCYTKDKLTISYPKPIDTTGTLSATDISAEPFPAYATQSPSNSTGYDTSPIKYGEGASGYADSLPVGPQVTSAPDTGVPKYGSSEISKTPSSVSGVQPSGYGSPSR